MNILYDMQLYQLGFYWDNSVHTVNQSAAQLTYVFFSKTDSVLKNLCLLKNDTTTKKFQKSQHF
jgi:hypothetical protein